MHRERTLTPEQALIRQQFVHFFEGDSTRAKYIERIREMIRVNSSRAFIHMGDLLRFSLPNAAELDGIPTLGAGILFSPHRYVPLCEFALQEAVARQQVDYLDKSTQKYMADTLVHAAFEGPMGRVLTPRGLKAKHLHHMVAVRGVVTQLSPLRPRLAASVNYCPETGRFSRREFNDHLSPQLSMGSTIGVIPRTDLDGNPLRMELGLSHLVDSQCAVLQEAPEAAPSGQLPRHVELRMENDLVDALKPGDRVVAVGIFASYVTGGEGGGFRSILLVNNLVRSASLRHQTIQASIQTDLDKFHSRASRIPGGVVGWLTRSIAPSLFGLEAEKLAILLLMVGGVERENQGTRIRGDINVLLVGEPSTAKSQLLRYTLTSVPHALSTTGRGSSGVGLTAAVTVDSYTGERTLSAGAMVLADRGVLCIDEFDKMDVHDRVAMHEALEQQTVTVAKAGTHAQLHARCSVLAAANPIYGFYSAQHSLPANIGLPETLLSRFDLVFVVLDRQDAAHNRHLSHHILRNHRTARDAPTTTEEAGVNQLNTATGTEEDGTSLIAAPEDPNQPIPLPFLQFYTAHCRTISPSLTPEAEQLIANHYCALRESGTLPDAIFVTTRSLEAIIRLSTAHAKLRLSSDVCEQDVVAAVELIRISMSTARGTSGLLSERLSALHPIGTSHRGEDESVSPAQPIQEEPSGKWWMRQLNELLDGERRSGRYTIPLSRLATNLSSVLGQIVPPIEVGQALTQAANEDSSVALAMNDGEPVDLEQIAQLENVTVWLQ